ncbi:cyclase family protein [Rhodobacteraceae bacterium NNCM2]|nr:cyclase family protein [Coraliihabitans acroporae]
MRFAIWGAAALSAGLAAGATAQDWTTSAYGPDDQAGASNLMTPEKVIEAIGLMKSGTVTSLGRTYEAAMPLFGSRVFALRGTGGLAGGPLADNEVIWMDDFLTTEIGQVGTQFDGLAHIGVGGAENMFYNGLTSKDVAGSYGVKALGIEHVKPFFTRAVLFDIKALRGRRMDAGEEITVADLEEALGKQGVEPPGKGDVAILHTGWGELWIEDNDTFNSGAPGIGLKAARWLVDKGVAIVGSDTWPVEVVPNPGGLAFPVHQEFIPKNGIFIHENLATERLADAGVYEFAYIYAPMPIKGATGSPGAPLAVY